MASLYSRPRSPFFWIKYRDPNSGRLVRESTGVRRDSEGGKQLANRKRAEAEVKELSAPQVRHGERWQAWAREYLDDRYLGSGSHKNALTALADLLAFFEAHSIYTPRMLSYATASQFMKWRLSAKTLPRIHHNTARLRFVYLSVLMSEAVRRGFADGNPCREVKAGKIAAKAKLEISAEHEAQIVTLLASSKPWMLEQWRVLMLTGCRIAETVVPLDRIDTEEMTITFKLKGGKLHTAPLHRELMPLVERARCERRPTLIAPPAAAHAVWCLWFKKHGFPYSAHCTRVTVITRLLRDNFSPAKVCALIGHSEEVNVIYRRLKPTDVRELLSALGSSRESANRSTGSRDSLSARRGRGGGKSGLESAGRSPRAASR
ncbi:MAG: site-specific integrase [Chthoniobacteraceae bacterium]